MTEETGTESTEPTSLKVVGDEQEGARDDVRRTILALRDKADESYWELAIALEECYEKAYYTAWGFARWQDYVEEELDWHIRKAQYLVRLQQWFNKMPDNIQKWVQGLGWTKARLLMNVVTVENAGEWRNKVAGKTVSEIEKLLKAERQLTGGGEGSDAGGESGGPEEKPTKKSFSLFPAQMANVNQAIEKAGEVAESDKEGHCLDLICTDYLAGNAGVDDFKSYFEAIERATGLAVVAYSRSDDALVFGGDFVDEMVARAEAESGELEVAVDGDPLDESETPEA